jgi:hypothetical protein
MRALRSDTGQASIEWLVVVGVVTSALAVAGAAAGAPQIAGVVVRQFDRALCIVSHGECDLDRAPCVTTSDADKQITTVSAIVFKVSDTSQLLVEQLSSGQWRVTHLHDDGAGIDYGVGAHLSLSGLGLKLAMGGEARASVLAHLGHADSWVAPTMRGALLLAMGLHGDDAHPAQSYSQHGIQVSGQATIVGAEGGAGVQASQDEVDGTRTDNTTHRVTTYSRTLDDFDLSVQVGDGLVGGAGMHRTATTELGLTADANGRPVDFEIVRVVQSSAGLGLPGWARSTGAALKKALRARAGRGNAVEIEAHLDLTDPDNLAAAMAYEHASAAGRLTALRAVNARLMLDGVVQVRRYHLSRNSIGASVSLALGEKYGASYDDTSTTMKLVDAWVLGPDGVWTQRDDCLAAA